MAQNQYLWDIEQLQTLHNSLNEQLEVLKSNKDNLINIDDNIKNCWAGMSASTFYEKMDFDVETYQNVILYLEQQISYLNEIITDCYSKCEKDIEDRLKSLANSIE